jgi:hypothetical protein
MKIIFFIMNALLMISGLFSSLKKRMRKYSDKSKYELWYYSEKPVWNENPENWPEFESYSKYSIDNKWFPNVRHSFHEKILKYS